MKRIILAACLIISLTGCDKFLHTESYTNKNTANFPQNKSDLEAMITSVYATQISVDGPNVTKNHPYFYGEAASDDRFGGGGAGSLDIQALDKLMVSHSNQFSPIWNVRYQGIYRANHLLEAIDRCKDVKEEDKNVFIGEAYFFRALFYWELAQTFETVPLVLKTEPENLPRASVDELYAQIASDFINSIKLLPNIPYNQYQTGRITKWVAEGYLARVFLFYTGFYNKASLPTLDGSLSKTQVVDYLADCIDNSGHGLLDKFGNLWTYSNEWTKPNYKYAQDLDLVWAGDDNKEVMHSYRYSKLGATNSSQRNLFSAWNGLSVGKLKKEATFPYGQAWAFGSICQSTWDYWEANNSTDVRKLGSIIDLDNELKLKATEKSTDGFKGWEETLYRAKKHLPITTLDAKKKATFCFSVNAWGVPNANVKSYINNFTLMRFAEILLMQSELTEDAKYMNLVRARAGMPAVSYSLQNIQDERRWELSFEGFRWNDIRRWHIAENVLDNQIGETVYNMYKKSTIPTIANGYVARYKKTKGFWMIPQTEIDLSNGVLTQNPGWEETDNYIYTGWK